MSSPTEAMVALMGEIAEFQAERRAATTPEERIALGNMIIATQNTLTELIRLSGTRDKELEDLKKDEVRERIEFARSLAAVKLRIEVAKARREEAKAAIWELQRDRKSSQVTTTANYHDGTSDSDAHSISSGDSS